LERGDENVERCFAGSAQVDTASAGSERTIMNVAAGTQATDAVKLDQLNASMNQANQYTDQQVNALGNTFGAQINQVARSAYSGIAAATTLTTIPDVDPGKRIAVGVGTANFKGHQAAALGATPCIMGNLKVRLGAGMSGWDDGGGRRLVSVVEDQWACVANGASPRS